MSIYKTNEEKLINEIKKMIKENNKSKSEMENKKAVSEKLKEFKAKGLWIFLRMKKFQAEYNGSCIDILCENRNGCWGFPFC